MGGAAGSHHGCTMADTLTGLGVDRAAACSTGRAGCPTAQLPVRPWPRRSATGSRRALHWPRQDAIGCARSLHCAGELGSRVHTCSKVLYALPTSLRLRTVQNTASVTGATGAGAGGCLCLAVIPVTLTVPVTVPVRPVTSPYIIV